jgi:hypothetical protein
VWCLKRLSEQNRTVSFYHLDPRDAQLRSLFAQAF